jgi:peroxiredoxin
MASCIINHCEVKTIKKHVPFYLVMTKYLKIHKIFKVLMVNVDYDYVLNSFKQVASSNVLIIAKSSLSWIS